MTQGRKILYVAGGRSITEEGAGMKIHSILSCWERMGYVVRSIFGGDLPGGIGPSRERNEYGHSSHYQKWYRRTGLLNPLIHTISERRDIRHDATMVQHLEGLCNSFNPDVIWERSCRLHCAGLRYARIVGIPYVLEWKDNLVTYKCSLFRLNALRMEARKNREANHIVVESHVLRGELQREGVDADKIIVSHNAVQVDQFSRNEEKRAKVRRELGVEDETVLVGYLGSYAFYHDTARLVLATDIIRKRGAAGRVKVLMVGAGKEYPGSLKLAEKMGLLDDILIMKPGVPKEEVPGILAALDIAVLPGSTDIICPIKVQEYMAAELPSVVPDYACNREVIDNGRTGVLFSPRDEQALAAKISALAVDSQARLRIGQEACEEVRRRFTWENTWGAALRKVIEDARG